jgi:hypothetical protein
MIDAFHFGKITVNSQTYRSDVIIYPDRVVDSWWRKEGHSLCLEDLADVIAFHPEVLILGQGNPGLMEVPESMLETLRQQKIEVHVAPTREAVRLYNSYALRRKTVAALHLTC